MTDKYGIKHGLLGITIPCYSTGLRYNIFRPTYSIGMRFPRKLQLINEIIDHGFSVPFRNCCGVLLLFFLKNLERWDGSVKLS
jgi:hypothetical protein